MAVQLSKDSIDLGIVTTNPEAMINFYKDILGLKFDGEMDMPGGGHMTRLLCGSSTIKIVVNGREPGSTAAPGGLAGGTGYRYFTMVVSNLEEAVKICEDAGCKIPVSPRAIREGVTIAMIEDPDRNWVELVTYN